MVSTERLGGESDYYVGVPNETFMAAFDGFERVEVDAAEGDRRTAHRGCEVRRIYESVRVQAQRTRRRIALLARRRPGSPDGGQL